MGFEKVEFGEHCCKPQPAVLPVMRRERPTCQSLLTGDIDTGIQEEHVKPCG